MSEAPDEWEGTQLPESLFYLRIIVDWNETAEDHLSVVVVAASDRRAGLGLTRASLLALTNRRAPDFNNQPYRYFRSAHVSQISAHLTSFRCQDVVPFTA